MKTETETWTAISTASGASRTNGDPVLKYQIETCGCTDNLLSDTCGQKISDKHITETLVTQTCSAPATPIALPEAEPVPQDSHVIGCFT